MKKRSADSSRLDYNVYSNINKIRESRLLLRTESYRSSSKPDIFRDDCASGDLTGYYCRRRPLRQSHACVLRPSLQKPRTRDNRPWTRWQMFRGSGDKHDSFDVHETRDRGHLEVRKESQ